MALRTPIACRILRYALLRTKTGRRVLDREYFDGFFDGHVATKKDAGRG